MAYRHRGSWDFLVRGAQRPVHDRFLYHHVTGFFAADYGMWGHFAVGIAFLAVFLGACSGSAGGGIKTFRLQILSLMIQQQGRQLMLPNGLFQVHYNGKIIRPNVQAAVGGFLFVYFLSWMIVAACCCRCSAWNPCAPSPASLTALQQHGSTGQFRRPRTFCVHLDPDVRDAAGTPRNS